MPQLRGVMMQYFHWYVDEGKPLWKVVEERAKVSSNSMARGSAQGTEGNYKHVPVSERRFGLDQPYACF